MALTKASFAMISGAQINALDYGAVGDGTTDNTAAFAAAVAALAAQGGGVLYIPKGTYKYNQFLIDSSNINVRGDGIGATVLRPQGWIDGVRFAKGYPSPTAILKNVGIEHVTVDGTDQLAGPNDTNGNGINFNSCSVAWARFCEVKKTKQQGLTSTYFSLTSPASDFQEAFWITDNYIDNSLGLQIAVAALGFTRSFVISRNIIRNVSTGNGVGIFTAVSGVTPPDGGKTGIISDNIIDGDADCIGIKIEGAMSEIVVADNKITGCDNSVTVGFIDTPAAQTTNYVFTGNQFLDWTTSAFIGNALTANSKTIFSSNSIVSSATTAWAMIVADGFFISNNRFEVATVLGILLVGDGTVVSSNYISGTSSYSIDAFSQSSTNSVITGNYVSSEIVGAADSKIFGNVGASAQNWTLGYIGAKKSISNPNGNSAPASGTWAVGDKVWNTTPTAAGYIGWVCVTAGTPGTWKEFGAIAA